MTSCQQHKVQMVADKVVLTKAWASLPASLQIFRLVGTESADADTGMGETSDRNLTMSIDKLSTPICVIM